MTEQFTNEMDADASISCSFSSSEEIQKHSMNVEKTTKKTKLVAFLVVLVGAIASGSFLYIGITNSKHDVEDNFERRASDMAKEIDGAWADYDSSALWIHESCRNWRTSNFTREDFEVLYNYLISGGLEFFAAEWVPNITHAERPAIEAEGKVGWAGVEGINFTGLVGQEPDPDHPGELMMAPRSKQDWYFPVVWGEPKSNIGAAAGYDLFSPPWERPSILKAVDTWSPALTGRFRLVQQTAEAGYSVVLYHPGTPLPDKFEARSRDMSTMVINIKSLLMRAARYQRVSQAAYLFDITLSSVDEEALPEFLSGIEIRVSDEKGDEKEVSVYQETDYASLQNSELYFERDLRIGGRVWKIVILPVGAAYDADYVVVVVCGVLIFLASVLLAIWMLHNMQRSIEMNRIITQAAAEASIVTNLFPPNVRKRMIEDAETKQKALRATKSKDGVRNRNTLPSSTIFRNTLTSEGVFGSKPIAELHPYTTVMVADLVGFTAWASVREPSQVFTLLELIFHHWDLIAARRRVYKVETVGDSYVAVAGLPSPRSDHASAMSRFAADCRAQMHKTCKALEKTLGPETGDIGARFGLHSGQCVAGVLRGERGRFQIFGDTINMAARMESTGVRDEIQLSAETAELLTSEGHEKWLVPRKDQVMVKGIGHMQTFFLNLKNDRTFSGETERTKDDIAMFSSSELNVECSKIQRLVDWNSEVLGNLLRSILARREGMQKDQNHSNLSPIPLTTKSEMVLDEVKDIITLPAFDANAMKKQVDPDSIQLDGEVWTQLSSLIAKIASMYRSNPFHSFEHASHVTMSVLKMLGRIVAPKEITVKNKSGNIDHNTIEAELHDHTFGVTSDPLTHFACAFSALIHDLDHQGIPNTVLVQESAPLALKYKNKSVAEQHSVSMAFALLMSPEYTKLRETICCDEEEFARFRSLVVNSVMATDIMDKELGCARKARWNKAFSIEQEQDRDEDQQVAINRKATIVIEHLIQASDISHTMQHWHVYAKWNERLFQEMYKAYKAGRLPKDPSEGWYKGELGFFDFYIIPLAKKLFTCGVFGVSSDEFLNYALTNRKEWEQKGQDMVQRYLKNYAEEFGDDQESACVVVGDR
ncbi:Receptor-type guanylate cyclase gcy [Seminavis robusta]|uniref:Phosphodiesterase n=1 Tax=Seminavis robusta TaxID=568900 RepID=A0A9N8HGR2_9STRA|nr:Receptor-type guanylate cyclase gcy [Seminavis robusta]|eukprot:Sro499_g155000.1 Receptor-type guanylate cyclase gcy (1106) ;mRNA; f:14056-18652